MSIDRKTVWDQGNQLFSVGYGMKAIAELLGADGSDHELNDELVNGLHHAIMALGTLVLQVAEDMTEAANPEQVGGAQ
jgi:hypothetical protein